MAAPTSEATPQTDADGGADPVSDTEERELYRHKKRPEWGVAVLAWEKGKRRAYQFEDGRLRKFKKGYYSLLEPAKKTERPREAVVESLQNAIKAKGTKKSGKELKPVATFPAQVALFAEFFPKGFQDPEWIKEHRGTESGRTLKRHRNPAVEQVKETLSRAECEDILAEGRHEDLTLAVQELLASTSLVPISAVKPLKGLESGESQKFAEAAFSLLHGEGDFDERFKGYLDVMKGIYGGRPSWRLATALPALMFPEKQVCVRRSVFLRQAAVIAPTARYSKKARARSYLNFRRVAFAVKKRLQAQDLEPKDLLDVHDFIWVTLRNAALEHLDG